MPSVNAFSADVVRRGLSRVRQGAMAQRRATVIFKRMMRY
jgi:hypothetical protein